MLIQPLNRFLLFAILATCSVGTLTVLPAYGGECGCETACTECPPDACDCPCDCAPRKKPNLIYKTLDAVAGGIEKVLKLDKIHCGPGCDGCCDGGCETMTCDDGCDAFTLQEMAQPVISPPHYLHQTQPIAPPPPVLESPSVLSTPPATAPPTFDGPPTTIHSQGPPVFHGQSRGTPMQRLQPSVIEPQPFHAPSAGEPNALEPPVHPNETMPNPFLDDARVTSKRRVRPTSYEKSKTRQRPKTQPKRRNPRYSRSDAPSDRLVRTVR